MNGMKKDKESGQMTRIVLEDIGVKRTSKKRKGKKGQGKNREKEIQK